MVRVTSTAVKNRMPPVCPVAEEYYSCLQEASARDMLEEYSCLFNSPACARFYGGLIVRRVDKTVGGHTTHNHSNRLKRLAAVVLRKLSVAIKSQHGWTIG